MEGHAENARVGRGEGVDWIVKESFETEAEMKAYCTENFLARGRTNHNIGKRVTYLTCAHDDCDVKMRLIKKLDQELYVLEAAEGFELCHNHLEIVPGRGLSDEQKRITIECLQECFPSLLKFSFSEKVEVRRK